MKGLCATKPLYFTTPLGESNFAFITHPTCTNGKTKLTESLTTLTRFSGKEIWRCKRQIVPSESLGKLNVARTAPPNGASFSTQFSHSQFVFSVDSHLRLLAEIRHRYRARNGEYSRGLNVLFTITWRISLCRCYFMYCTIECF